MNVNFPILLLAALVPLIVGFIWYNPKTFGNAWMKAADISEDKMKGANMAKIFTLTYVLSFLAAFSLQFMVIHQYHIYSTLANDPGFMDPASETGKFITDFMAKYGTNFRTFKHGALHGTLGALFLVLPVLGINAMFERKGFKYIAINTGFWIVSLAVMGGIVCAYA